MPKNMSMRGRFLEKVQKQGTHWIWVGSRDRDGYGGIQQPTGNGGQRYTPAHIMAYELYKGQVPKGMVVMHMCDTPKCVNPAHLKLGTTASNIADKVRKNRNNPPHRLG